MCQMKSQNEKWLKRNAKNGRYEAFSNISLQPVLPNIARFINLEFGFGPSSKVETEKRLWSVINSYQENHKRRNIANYIHSFSK